MDSCPAARRRSPVNEDDLLEDRFFFQNDSTRFRHCIDVSQYIADRALNRTPQSWALAISRFFARKFYRARNKHPVVLNFRLTLIDELQIGFKI